MATKAATAAKGWSGGFDGKPYTITEMRAKLAKLPPIVWARRVVLHNTGMPDMKRTAEIGASKYVKNVANYFKNPQYDKKGKRLKGPWSGGPHFFVAQAEPEPLLFEGTPVTVPGVHSPSWNGFAVGIEMCADFDKDDANLGAGLAVKDTACKLIAALLNKLGLPANDDTIKLHKEDPGTDHACPGRSVDKNDIVSRVRDYLADQAPAGEHDPYLMAAATKVERAKPDLIIGASMVDELNLRAASGMAGAVLAVLAKDTPVEIEAEADNAVTKWLYVNVPSLRKKGWVSSRFITVGGQSVAQPKDNPTRAVVFFVANGLEPHQAFGLVGNFQRESYADLKTDAVGDGGTAHGIAQWHSGGRYEQLVAFAKERDAPWTDLETQCAFVLHELATSEKKAGDAVKAAKTTEEAVKGAIGYERPRGWSRQHPERGDGYVQRLNYALALEAKWQERHSYQIADAPGEIRATG
jgi:hypothetical protein